MFVLIFGALSAFLLLQALVPQLRRRLLDLPNTRSSHLHPIPRGGGAAFVAVSSFFSLLSLFSGVGLKAAALPLMVLPLAIVGLLDDRYNLPVAVRYCSQLFVSILVIKFSPLVQALSPSSFFANWVFFALIFVLVIGSTAVINFANFMDGLDGLLAGCMLVIIAASTIYLSAPWPLWGLVGSLIGFLFWNWSPAKVFMGDVGSTFLGAVFFGLVLQASGWLDALGLLLVATPLLADAFFCLIRRLFNGQRVFEPHRLHLYQRLHQAGWTHSQVSCMYIAATVMLAVALFAGDWPCLLVAVVAQLLVGVWLDKRVALPFALASMN